MLSKIQVGASLLLAILLLAGCAAMGLPPSAQKTAGELLDEVGNSFLRTVKVYERLIKDKAISPEEYREWVEFVPKFQAMWDHAYQLWTASGESKELRALILRLQEELLVFVLKRRGEP